MKKLYYTLAAAVMTPAIIFSVAHAAPAERDNTPPAQLAVTPCNCGDDADCLKKCDKKMHKKGKHHKKGCMHEKIMKDYTTEVNEDYDKAIKRINESSFSDKQKKLLRERAEENRDFSLKQMEARHELMKEQMEYREDLDMTFDTENKADRKAIKKIMEIGWDD